MESRVIAVFGPTAVGKTGVVDQVARMLRESGADPVAINCDSIQVYRELRVLSGAADIGQGSALEYRLVGFVPVTEEYSAGLYADAAHREIDAALGSGRLPIVVGGTGLYLRAALSRLEMRPPVDPDLRAAVEAEIAERGPQALHAELPPELRDATHPNDRKRIARYTELLRGGDQPHATATKLWTADLRHPTLMAGLTMERDPLVERVRKRVDRMFDDGVEAEVRAADAAGASRTARAAIGFSEALEGDRESMARAQAAYARRQMTWMRKLQGIRTVDRTGLDSAETARRIIRRLDGVE